MARRDATRLTVPSREDTMTENAHQQDCIALDEPESIEHLSQLSVGDRVLIDDRRRPLTVINIGVREIGDERIGDDGAELETPIVRLEGHWDGAVTIELGHQVKRTAIVDGEYQPVLEELDPIVDFDLGRKKDVRRTHVAGSRARAANESSEVPA
jgi:hypothetical protein